MSKILKTVSTDDADAEEQDLLERRSFVRASPPMDVLEDNSEDAFKTFLAFAVGAALK